MESDLKPLLRNHIEALVMDEGQIEQAMDEMASLMPETLRDWLARARHCEETFERARLAAASSMVAAGILRSSKPQDGIDPGLWVEVVFDACDLPALAGGDLWLTEFAAQSLQYALACDSDEPGALPSVAPELFSAAQKTAGSWSKLAAVQG